MARVPEDWQEGAWCNRVPVPAARGTVWEHSAAAHRPRVLRLDNPTAGSIRVWVSSFDERVSRTVELRLGPGGGDELRVRGAVKVEAMQLTAAGSSLDLAIVAAEAIGDTPNTDTQVTLPAGAPGAWTEVGALPGGRRWVTISVFGDATNVELGWFEATGVTAWARWTVLANSAPSTHVHPPSLKLFARSLGPNAATCVAAWAAR
jgi:hypothetical protein